MTTWGFAVLIIEISIAGRRNPFEPDKITYELLTSSLSHTASHHIDDLPIVYRLAVLRRQNSSSPRREKTIIGSGLHTNHLKYGNAKMNYPMRLPSNLLVEPARFT